MSRRAWLASLPALLAGPALLERSPMALGRGPGALEPGRATAGGVLQVAPIRALGLHSVTLAVSDVARSTSFYQGLFGCPVVGRHGSAVLLGIGDGPRYLALVDAGTGPPAFRSFGIAVEGFDAEATARALAGHGLERGAGDGPPGPLRFVVRTRGDTPELSLGDPHGLVVRLHDPRDCGGAGPRGDRCPEPEPAPSTGPLALLGISHFTNNAADPDRANDFYRRLFGMEIQAYQAAAPLLGVGPGDDFLMFIDGAVGRTAEEAARRPSRVHHACFTVADFSVPRVQAALEGRGIRPRPEGASGPFQHWVSMRMPNRGGAEGGTPELYFSDPDGLSIQLQDPSYCGGGGYLGDVCD